MTPIGKLEKARNIIRADYANHGQDTGDAMRAYVENRISHDTYKELAASGIKIFNSGG